MIIDNLSKRRIIQGELHVKVNQSQPVKCRCIKSVTSFFDLIYIYMYIYTVYRRTRQKNKYLNDRMKSVVTAYEPSDYKLYQTKAYYEYRLYQVMYISMPGNQLKERVIVRSDHAATQHSGFVIRRIVLKRFIKKIAEQN